MTVCKQLMSSRTRGRGARWVLAQGPTPGLRGDWRRSTSARAFVFFTYLYYPTVMGLSRVRRRVLVPTAHDEPPIRHRIYRRVFAEADALAFNTEEEQAFVRGRFDVATRPQAIVGCGVEMADDAAARAASDVVPEAPFVLYLGRLDRAKGVDALARGWEAFQRRFGGQSFQRRGGAPVLGRDLRLVLAGGGDMALPERADILRLGFVGEAAKTALLRRAELLAMPSLYESLSLVMLEAWTVGCPVLVNAECEVTLGHVERCAGGRAYRGEDALVTELAAMLGDAAARAEAAARGQAYVAERYAWPVVEERMMGLIRQVAPRPSREQDAGLPAWVQRTNIRAACPR